MAAERSQTSGGADSSKDPVFLLMVSGQLESAEVRGAWNFEVKL